MNRLLWIVLLALGGLALTQGAGYHATWTDEGESSPNTFQASETFPPPPTNETTPPPALARLPFIQSRIPQR